MHILARTAAITAFSLCAFSAQAEVSQSDTDFIKKLNASLHPFASQNSVIAGYEDIELIDNPTYERYYSFKNPKIEQVSQGLHYELTARNIGLMRLEEAGAYHLALPRTITMHVSTADQSKESPYIYKIKLYGIESLDIKGDRSSALRYYKLDASDKIELRISKVLLENGKEKIIKQATIDFNGSPFERTQWTNLTPFSSAEIGSLLARIVNDTHGNASKGE